jgi:hypothetical protein
MQTTSNTHRSRKLTAVLTAAAIAATASITVLGGGTPAGAQAGTTTVAVTETAPWGSGNAPYAADWFEVTNFGASAVDITGWKMDDNSNSFASSVALAGITSIAAGESVIFMENPGVGKIDQFRTLWGTPSIQIGTYAGSGVGLSTGGDAVNLFTAAGALVTGVNFGASGAVAPFRSFENAGGLGSATFPTPSISAFSSVGVNGAYASTDNHGIGSPGVNTTGGSGTTTTTSTTTTVPGPPYSTWPGSQTVTAVDPVGTFTSNLSGLDFEGDGSTGGTLWAALNGPGTLFKLVPSGAEWIPDVSNGWGAGKTLRYPNGLGNPDAEGVTFVGGGAAIDGLYVATERNNDASSTSRNAILRFDPAAAGTTLTATNEWNITADLPANGANLGLEGITWVDDSYLVSRGFFDERLGNTYNPAAYPNHGTGLFLVGVEGTGNVFAYALNKADNSFLRVATFSSGFASVMDLQFDRDLEQLWAVCDNTCTGRSHVVTVNPTNGRFEVTGRFERPTGMPDTNNEGFAVATQAYCSGNEKPAFWGDDNDLGGNSLRVGTVSCSSVIGPDPVIPEFPAGGVLLAMLAGVGLVVLVFRRRQLSPT